jgi:alanine dehydrogenase
MKLAQHSLAAVKCDQGFREGVNTYRGNVTCAGVAESQHKPLKDIMELL